MRPGSSPASFRGGLETRDDLHAVVVDPADIQAAVQVGHWTLLAAEECSQTDIQAGTGLENTLSEREAYMILKQRTD